MRDFCVADLAQGVGFSIRCLRLRPWSVLMSPMVPLRSELIQSLPEDCGLSHGVPRAGARCK